MIDYPILCNNICESIETYNKTNISNAFGSASLEVEFIGCISDIRKCSSRSTSKMNEKCEKPTRFTTAEKASSGGLKTAISGGRSYQARHPPLVKILSV